MSDFVFGQVGLHQGSVLSPLLFAIVTLSVRDGSLLELLYADDLVLCGASVEEVMGKYKKWREELEGKRLCVNVGKTKGMQLLKGKWRVTTKTDPCGVCGERGGCKSIKYLQCKKWVHHRCSDVSHKVGLTAVRDVFVCRSCLGLVAAEVEVPVSKCGNDKPEMVNKFCYLGDMLRSCVGVTEAVSARIGSALKKF